MKILFTTLSLAYFLQPAFAIDYSKRVFTRVGAIVCPLESFMDVRAGHSTSDMTRMFSDPNDREMHAHAQHCEVWQAGVVISVAPSFLIDEWFPEGIPHVTDNKTLLLLYDTSGDRLRWLVTAVDEVTNSPTG
ncbi:MAG: hypothetical protein ACLQFF_12500 [Steroidobacteraceae bacterium]|jgi:hypothetical protein